MELRKKISDRARFKNFRYFMMGCLVLLYGGSTLALTLKSTAFNAGGTIPVQYTCDGKDISIPLSWEGAPAQTRSFTLITDDPDAPVGNWVHWALFNIPSNVQSLPENIQTLPTGTLVGKNSWGRTSYGGPCPPDREHRYFFKLYALDNILSLTTGASKTALEAAMQGHILEQAELMCRYKRQTQV